MTVFSKSSVDIDFGLYNEELDGIFYYYTGASKEDRVLTHHRRNAFACEYILQWVPHQLSDADKMNELLRLKFHSATQSIGVLNSLTSDEKRISSDNAARKCQ
ncbi:hypothetical protein V3C99_001179 [Haemonchus contortus]